MTKEFALKQTGENLILRIFLGMFLFVIVECGPKSAVEVDDGGVVNLSAPSGKDILYQTPSGFSDKFAKLDVHVATDSQTGKKPNILFVHGGGWSTGDKANIQKNAEMIPFFTNRGYNVISINHRLFEDPDSPNTTYKDQATDIARALKWSVANIERYNGKVDNFTLIGFSSGAHLVSLVGTDESYLKNEGLSLDIIKGVISVDVPQYDVPLSLNLIKGTYLEIMTSFLLRLFGTTPDEQLVGSPASYVGNPKIKPFLLISGGIKDGRPQDVSNQASIVFKDLLLANGHLAKHAHYPKVDHTGLVMSLGKSTAPITTEVASFLTNINRQK